MSNIPTISQSRGGNKAKAIRNGQYIEPAWIWIPRQVLFYLEENDDGSWSIVFKGGNRYPATDTEVELWRHDPPEYQAARKVATERGAKNKQPAELWIGEGR